MNSPATATAPTRFPPSTAALPRFAHPVLAALLCFFALQLGGRSFSSDITHRTHWALAPEESELQVWLTRFQLTKNLFWEHFTNIFANGQAIFLRQSASSDLTVHEWGTFTSIAGPDGLAMDWLPLTGSTDLPSFVEHFRGARFKGGLRGTTRMETPVLYFYSARETTVSVKVAFAGGLITELYPHADSLNPNSTPRDLSLYDNKFPGSIKWNSVHIAPQGSADFPSDNSGNHYYAARQTSSTPLLVDTPSGPQHEKFLFYRGVSAFLPPLSAALSSDNTVQLQNHYLEPIPNVILFERRGNKATYRVLGVLRDRAALAPLDLSGSIDSLSSNLEGILISQGLFPDEAHAMLETWNNSWFEEGSRLIYFLPRSFVDSVLPLTIKPAPANTVRVFVGRLELITPATQQAVESAFASSDRANLAKYTRFLEPILRSMIRQFPDPARQRRLTEYLNSVYTDLDTQQQPN